MDATAAARHRSSGAYQRERARILAGNPLCHWGCGRLATTADHEPPLEVTGHPHLNLVPACIKCNVERRYYPPPAMAASTPSREWF
ncbi:MAG: hypothetical protein M3404_01910 [Actinomycetota bacterium]|nr:hypothetical protein [Actinomycetota bacterium]